MRTEQDGMGRQEAWQAELDWLFARQRFGVHPGLGRVQALLARLGTPQASFRTVLVGGTNGKGSTAATLAAMLRAGGTGGPVYQSAPDTVHGAVRGGRSGTAGRRGRGGAGPRAPGG
ncbi:hypothetical protein [Deinococcus aquaticus]|uniref:hypothetical protein n=1 Tax=Deinococcus aquaticus TaxID=328692 RepID=UPI0036107D16